MAFKMNGWNAGEGTGSGAAFKKAQAAYKKEVTKPIPGDGDKSITKDRPTKTSVDVKDRLRRGDGSSFKKSNVGKHQGTDKQAGIDVAEKNRQKYKDEFLASDAGKKQFNTEIKKSMADGMSEKDAIAKAQAGYDARRSKEINPKMRRDFAYGSDKNLPALVKERDKLKASGDTSSKEYQEIQNRINKSYNVDKRHGQTTETTEKKGGRVTETTTTTPGIGTTTTKTKKNKKGETTKIKEKQQKDDYYGGDKFKIKLKEDKVDNADFTDKGNLSAKTGEVSKDKTQKQFRDTKVGQSKIGQLFVKKNRRKKKDDSPNKKVDEKTRTNPLTGKTRTTRKFTDIYGNKKKRVSVTDKYGKETKYKSKTESGRVEGDVRRYKQKGDKTVYSGKDVELGRGLYRSSNKPPKRGYN